MLELNESNEFHYFSNNNELDSEKFNNFFYKDTLDNCSYNRIVFDEKEIFKSENIESNNDKSSSKKEQFKIPKDEYFHILSSKKRGRKSNVKVIKIHSKLASDNILRKIQVHYLNFIVLFTNLILKLLGFDIKLLHLSYTIKQNINKRHIENLKNCTLREILSNDISSKYTKKSKSENSIILANFIKCPILEKILSEKYTYLSDIYLNNQRIINLDRFGLDKKFELPIYIELFDDLLNRYKENNEYIKRLKECIVKYFS